MWRCWEPLVHRFTFPTLWGREIQPPPLVAIFCGTEHLLENSWTKWVIFWLNKGFYMVYALLPPIWQNMRTVALDHFPQDNWKPPPKRLGFRVLGFRNTIQAWVAYFLAEKRRWKGLATIRFFFLCPFTFFEWNLGCGKCFTKWVKSECLRDFSLSETSPSESVLGKGWNG